MIHAIEVLARLFWLVGGSIGSSSIIIVVVQQQLLIQLLQDAPKAWTTRLDPYRSTVVGFAPFSFPCRFLSRFVSPFPVATKLSNVPNDHRIAFILDMGFMKTTLGDAFGPFEKSRPLWVRASGQNGRFVRRTVRWTFVRGVARATIVATNNRTSSSNRLGCCCRCCCWVSTCTCMPLGAFGTCGRHDDVGARCLLSFKRDRIRSFTFTHGPGSGNN
jgi:hypothetical protein